MRIECAMDDPYHVLLRPFIARCYDENGFKQQDTKNYAYVVPGDLFGTKLKATQPKRAALMCAEREHTVVSWEIWVKANEMCRTRLIVLALFFDQAAFEVAKQSKSVTRFLQCCNACAASGRKAKLRCCGCCGSAFYCNSECQQRDWPTHKNRCRSPSVGVCEYNDDSDDSDDQDYSDYTDNSDDSDYTDNSDNEQT